ncbi:DUF1344 domain-containing protein [Nitratireductor kimnyeongensis]|uniref:DUF1344 domain-containing protein n=1 Tax=Nitratireductor kimnyeongensis TaxID=430679 RepID=A0ABW0T3V2_9HYPH|nr:DUF1344 domain-containing protein [Nitratireductor kimnyeongensis]QZZ34905.1 DUF1344 domain-containing protein [Nitratireductor kimnyeongensis]
MRIFAAALGLLLLVSSAFALDTEGRVANVDPENLTITLENGQIFKLPAEMDVSAIEPGMSVIVAYREVDNGVKQITDMLLPD